LDKNSLFAQNNEKSKRGNMKKKCLEYGAIALGSFSLAFAVNFFLVPHKISSGGVSGIGIALFYLFDVPIFVTSIVINAVLFFFALRNLPKESIIKSGAGILLFSLFLRLSEGMAPPEGTTDLLIGAVFGGALIGFGIGLVLLFEGSTGGTDLLVLILKRKFSRLSGGKMIFLIDLAVILFSSVVLSDPGAIFYSAICMLVVSKTADFILVRGDFAKAVYLISEKERQIAEEIMATMHRGVTGVSAHGFFEKREKRMLLCVVRNREVPRLFEIIKKHDPHSFCMVLDAKNVLGKGFDAI
jgi:uncharacterized membrane-anchored protein YitT (DUF2179 family)